MTDEEKKELHKALVDLRNAISAIDEGIDDDLDMLRGTLTDLEIRYAPEDVRANYGF